MTNELKNDNNIKELGLAEISDTSQNSLASRESTSLSALGTSDFGIFLDKERFEQFYRVANLFAKSTIVPEHFRNNPSNCFIALQMAVRLKMEPMLVMQKSYNIAGKPAIESQIAISALNNSGLIKGRIRFDIDGEGENISCTAKAIDKASGEELTYTLKLKDAKKIGKASSNPNWSAIPELMLRYRAASFLIRTNFPEVLMGVYTKDELDDIKDGGMINVTNADELNERLKK